MSSELQRDELTARLSSLGLTNISQWDVLVFLHHHRNALVTPDLISRLIGYRAALITAALDRLEFLGLVERSRLSQGARLYRLVELDGARGRDFEKLLASADSRAGRLIIVNELQRQQKAMAAKQRSIAQIRPLKRAFLRKRAS